MSLKKNLLLNLIFLFRPNLRNRLFYLLLNFNLRRLIKISSLWIINNRIYLRVWSWVMSKNLTLQKLTLETKRIFLISRKMMRLKSILLTSVSSRITLFKPRIFLTRTITYLIISLVILVLLLWVIISPVKIKAIYLSIYKKLPRIFLVTNQLKALWIINLLIVFLITDQLKLSKMNNLKVICLIIKLRVLFSTINQFPIYLVSLLNKLLRLLLEIFWVKKSNKLLSQPQQIYLVSKLKLKPINKQKYSSDLRNLKHQIFSIKPAKIKHLLIYSLNPSNNQNKPKTRLNKTAKTIP